MRSPGVEGQVDAPAVWIISHDADIRHLIGLNLSKRGYRAVETCQHDLPPPTWAKPQLIILDVDPPDDSGWETAEALRRSAWGQGVPLIVLAATVPTARQLAPLQPVGWVEKPLAMDALLAMVRESVG